VLGVVIEKFAQCSDDMKRAVCIYKCCAEIHIPEALYRLGLCYLHGHGKIRDACRAMTLLTKAVELGYTDAQNVLTTYKPQ